MRLFATGAMNWVMGRALPDDVPIDSKMVTKAIERAQNTVEARNAEIRKDVLKYDEVMNEQRKVIYARRMQIIDGEDMRAQTIEVLSVGPRQHRRRPTAPGPTSRRTGISTAWSPRPGCTSRPQSTEEELAEAADTDSHLREPAGRGHRLLRGARGIMPAADGGEPLTPCVRSSGRSCSSSSTRSGASTSRRWTTCARASTCGPWASRIRWWPGSATATRCSAR